MGKIFDIVMQYSNAGIYCHNYVGIKIAEMFYPELSDKIMTEHINSGADKKKMLLLVKALHEKLFGSSGPREKMYGDFIPYSQLHKTDRRILPKLLLEIFSKRLEKSGSFLFADTLHHGELYVMGGGQVYRISLDIEIEKMLMKTGVPWIKYLNGTPSEEAWKVGYEQEYLETALPSFSENNNYAAKYLSDIRIIKGFLSGSSKSVPRFLERDDFDAFLSSFDMAEKAIEIFYQKH